MSRVSSKESSDVPEEKNLPNGVPDSELSAGGGGPASLGVSGDNPGSDKAKSMAQDTTGEEAKEAATAVCNTVTRDLSVGMTAPSPVAVNTQAKWSPAKEGYRQTLGMSIEAEVSLERAKAYLVSVLSC